MARKPFWPQYQSEKGWSLGMGAIWARPELATIVGDCLTRWPYVEIDLAVLLAKLLGSQSDPAMAMFATMRGYRNQEDAIEAAAAVTLTEQDADLVKSLLRVVRTASRARDDLAHGLWGFVPPVPDILIWIDAKHTAPWSAASVWADIKPAHEELARHFFVYTKDDLLEAKILIDEANDLTIKTSLYLASTDRTERAQRYSELSAQPHIREALDRLTQLKNRK
jgi:hypothetical protein